MNSTKNKKGNHFFSKKIWIILLTIFICFLLFGFYIIQGLPTLEELENPKQQLASKVWSIDGELLGQFYIENRIETKIDELPKGLLEALIATEDRKFYSHWGVDLERFLKAMIKNIFTFSREGASTITQQLAKNLYNLKSKKESSFETVVRKIREWISAIQIEKNFTKKEILELYLNVSYFGKSAYGVETAAKIYFDKKAKDLTLPESALLIALLKSSVLYDPERKEENAFKRRNVVLYNMVKAGYISEDQYSILKEEKIKLAKGKSVNLKSNAPHFMEYIRQQMISMADKYGYDLYRDGLNIYTTLDLRMQKIANKVSAEHLKEYQDLFNKNWKWEHHKSELNGLVEKAIINNVVYRESKIASERLKIHSNLKNHIAFVDSVKNAEMKIQVGFVVIEPKTGHINAMVGGENQEFLYGLNHVTQIKRQPGSSFKPIVYAVAIDNGYFPQYSLLNQKFDFEGWSPDNSDNEYSGYMTLREALAKSVNVIAGRLTISDIAPPIQVLKYAKKLGIHSQLPPYPSIALGTAEVSPLELTSAFATIANGGVSVTPISILKIEDRNGVLIDEFKPEFTEALSNQTSSVLINMMEDVLQYGTGAGARRWFSRPAAGKTGTTQDFADAWFIGFTPQLAGGVWVGFDDRRVRFTNWYGQGARAAMPIWAKFMSEVYHDLKIPLEYFNIPDGVESVQFCKESIDAGDSRLATDNCPVKISDFIVTDKKPQNCNIHSSGNTRYQKEKNNDTRW